MATMPLATVDILPLNTADICDANLHLMTSGELRVLQPIFQIYGSRPVFAGPVATVKLFEDNILVHELIREEGNGRVLVVDGGGSMRCAVLGGNLAHWAQRNGWVGIVVNGCIRDVNEINGCDIGIRALNSHPIKPGKKGNGEKHVPVIIAGTRICDGEWLYADADGILVSSTELARSRRSQLLEEEPMKPHRPWLQRKRIHKVIHHEKRRIKPGKIQLTEEQRARMEANRPNALNWREQQQRVLAPRCRPSK